MSPKRKGRNLAGLDFKWYLQGADFGGELQSVLTGTKLRTKFALNDSTFRTEKVEKGQRKEKEHSFVNTGGNWL